MKTTGAWVQLLTDQPRGEGGAPHTKKSLPFANRANSSGSNLEPARKEAIGSPALAFVGEQRLQHNHKLGLPMSARLREHVL